jgi:hypothetical protein
MTIRIDVSRALTTHEERAALVRAVVPAQPEDELDWIEWKVAGRFRFLPNLVGREQASRCRCEPPV